MIPEDLAAFTRDVGTEDDMHIVTVPYAGLTVAAVMSRIAAAPREVFDPRVDIDALRRQTLPGSASYPRWISTNPDDTPDQHVAVVLTLWLRGSEELLGPIGGGRGDRPITADRWARAAATMRARVAPFSPPATWLIDAERREEAARWLLLGLGVLPDGESRETARARLDALDSLRHGEAGAAARAEYEHRLEVARALRAQAAREAAQRYSAE